MFSNSYYPKQSGRAVVTVHFLNQGIYLLKKNIVGPTGKDRHFSMKMLPAPGLETRLQPGCFVLHSREQDIHLREKNIVGPTERSRRRLVACASSQGRTGVFR